ncbi:NifU N-terminal domain-containing protein [Bradyrhizobium sp.]|uniref:NifU N-terminal domain-containing protein n=1 Tax=Bradyrhizobium sp. TaxID=376 RepID=UPI00262D8C09|nr:NifU N-terminal domain-containing protein [Bradyrhizobium sp.]
MFIQTEATPDPARLKFLPGRVVLAEGVLNLLDKTQAAASPLAERLFAIPEISAVFLGSDSITVTKVSGNWQLLKPAILGAIMEHFLSEAPVLRQGKEAKGPSSSRPTEGRPDLVERIREALRQVIDPEVGYNIFDLGLVYDVAVEEGGVVCLTMTTTTPGCPATNYLKDGAARSASNVPGVEFVDVKLTYEPRWTPEMMSPEAKAHLGIR